MLLLCYGTRPEYIKLKPIIAACNDRKVAYKTLMVEQHDHSFIHDEKPTFVVSVVDAENRLDSILGSIANFKNEMFVGVGVVIVQGDTASAFLCALAAYHRKKFLVHLEAGLRTYDLSNPYPEEGYRQMISRIANVHICPTKNNADNLTKERIESLRPVLGNTALDNLLNIQTIYGDEVLITMHRRENKDNLASWFKAFDNLAKDYKDLKFLLPLHPSISNGYRLHHVKIIDPLPHIECLALMARCRLIITDSGGIQEEASFLKKKTIVCRKKTERIESVGTSSFLCPYPSSLKTIFKKANVDYVVIESSPYGDGKSAGKLLDFLYGQKNKIGI